MNAQTVRLLTLVFFFMTPLLAGRGRKEIAPLGSGGSGNALLESIPYTELRKICQGTVVENFGGWFPDWIVQYLKLNRYVAPTEMTGHLQKDVVAHIKSIRDYLQLFEAQAQTMKKYPQLYLSLEVRDMLTKVSAIASGNFANIYDSAGVVNDLQSKYSPFIDVLIQSLANTDIDPHSIDKIGAMFREEDLAAPSTENAALKSDLENLKDDLIDMLYHVLTVYTEPDNGPKYQALNDGKRAILQSFFDNFMYLLPDKQLREFVFEKLIGSTKKDGTYNGKFFGKSVFESLNQIPSAFVPLFKRDTFLMNYNPKFKLADLHDASQNFYFTWEFPQVFTGVEEKDLAINVPKDDSPTAKKQRKFAKLNLMLYKVFTFARTDGTLKPTDGNDPIAALRKLYRWVLDTKDFDEPKFDQNGERTTIDKGYEVIFRRDKFKRHFLPLLALICSKIPDCTMDMKKSPDQAAIFDKYKNFGNFEELKKKKNVAVMIDPLLLDQMEASLADDEFKKFSDDIEKLIEDNPDIKDPISQKDKPEGKIALVDPLKKANPKIFVPKNPNLQKEFDTKIGNKFLPNDGTKPSDSQKAQFNSFIETIESTDNLKKKNTLRTLLIKFLYTSYVKTPKITGPLISSAIPYLVDKFRHSYIFDHVRGLKNYLFMTLNKDMVIRYSPRSDDETLFYTLDFIFFVDLATEDEFKRLNSPQCTLDPTAKANRISVINQERATMKNNFYLNGKNVETYRLTIRKNFITKEPMFLEKLPAMEFFVYFLDFFDFYAKISNVAAAQYVNYHTVFMSFYSFMARVRSQILGEIDNPYQYLLGQLERCLEHTEKLQHWKEPTTLDPICQLSHRKYAEMYFFYKIYLLSTEKPFKSGIEERASVNFNTHTRLFILFASDVSDYRDALTKACQGKDSADGESICVSWKIYQNVISYVHTPDVGYTYLEKQLKEVGKQDALSTRVNMINGLEAAYINVYHSNMVDWEKVNFLFDSIAYRNGHSLYSQMKFKGSDVDGLTNYLKRTYSKLVVDPHEATLARAVQNIMNSKGRGAGQDALLEFLDFAGEFIPMYLKLFLQFSVSDPQFKRIAELLIEKGISYDLIQLNDIRNDGFFLSLAKDVSGMNEKDALTHLHKKLDEKYEALLQKCRRVTEESIQKSMTNESELDLLDSMLATLDQQDHAILEEHNNSFENNMLPEIIKEAKKVEIKGLQTPKPEPLKVDKLKVEQVMVKKVFVFTSKIEESHTIQFEEVADRDDETMSEFDLDIDMNDFEDDLKDGPATGDRSLINGISVDHDKLHLVTAISNGIMKAIQENAVKTPENNEIARLVKSTASVTERDSSPRSRSKSHDKSEKLATGILEALISKKATQTIINKKDQESQPGHNMRTRSQARAEREALRKKAESQSPSKRTDQGDTQERGRPATRVNRLGAHNQI